MSDPSCPFNDAMVTALADLMNSRRAVPSVTPEAAAQPLSPTLEALIRSEVAEQVARLRQQLIDEFHRGASWTKAGWPPAVLAAKRQQLRDAAEALRPEVE